MDKILILLLGLLAVFVAFLVFAYNQKSKLAEKKVKERFQSCDPKDPDCQQEHFNEGTGDTGDDCDDGDDCASDTCTNKQCQEQEHYTQYRENFQSCDPQDTDCQQEDFDCGTGTCFQEGFRSGNFNRHYETPAGQEFFQGYGIESFTNGGNYNQFNEHFQEESNGHEEEHYTNYNGGNIREDFDSQPLTLKLFYADWCGHCKRFKPTFDNELPQVIKRSGLGCKLQSVNADEQPELVRKYDVKGFPTLILEGQNGVIAEYNGDRSASDIQKFISKHL